MSSILNAFKSKHPFLLLLLPFILFAFWYKWLVNPVVDIDTTRLMPLSLYLVNWFRDMPIFLGVLSIVITFISSIILYFVVDRYDILKVGATMPSFLYVILVSCLPSLITFNPAVFASFFILIAFTRLLYAYNFHNSISCFFDAGFFVGLACAFYFQSIFFVVFVLIAMASIGRFNFRELIALLMGLFVPLLFMWTYLFYTDGLTHFYEVLKGSTHLIKIGKLVSMYEIVFIGVSVFVFFVSVASMFLRNTITVVFEIKFYTVLFWILFICILFPIFFYPLGSEIMTIAAIPFALFISRYFIVQRHRFFGDILFVIFLFFAIIIQFPEFVETVYSYL